MSRLSQREWGRGGGREGERERERERERIKDWGFAPWLALPSWPRTYIFKHKCIYINMFTAQRQGSTV